MRTLLLAVCLSILALLVFAVTTVAQDTIECPEGTAPTIDGTIEPGEWDDADNITLPFSLENDCTAYYKCSGNYLYVAFQFEDGHTTNIPDSRVLLDTNNDKADSPQTDDYELYINPDNGGTRERRGTGSDWAVVTMDNWTGEWNDTDSDRWSTEYSISFSKLTGNASSSVLGFGLVVYGNYAESSGWPNGADEDDPASWGNMTFSGAGPGARSIEIHAPTIIDVEEGKEVTATVAVKNSGSEVEIVSLDLVGDGAGWASLETDGFSLDPGEDVSVQITVSVPDGTAEGLYTIDLIADAGNGINDTASIRIDVSSSGSSGGGGDDDTPGFDLVIVTMAVATTVFFYRRR